MAQLMPLPLTVSCFSKIQIGFTFLVPAHLVVPEKGPLNGCVCVSWCEISRSNSIFNVLFRFRFTTTTQHGVWACRRSRSAEMDDDTGLLANDDIRPTHRPCRSTPHSVPVTRHTHQKTQFNTRYSIQELRLTAIKSTYIINTQLPMTRCR